MSMLEIASLGDKILSSGEGKLVYTSSCIDTTSNTYKQHIKHIIESVPQAVPINHLSNNVGYAPYKVPINHSTEKVYYAFNGAKIRCDIYSVAYDYNGEKSVENYSKAFNGVKMDTISFVCSNDSTYMIPINGFISNNNDIGQLYDPRFYMTVLGEPVASFIKSAGSFIKRESFNNHDCEVYKRKGDDGKVITAWLAPDLLYRPLQIEVLKDGKKSVFTNNYKKYDAIYVPESSHGYHYWYDSVSGEWLMSVKTSLTFEKEYTFNIQVPDSLFEIEYPKGMTVYDRRLEREITK
jgi:hypothetical protein